MDLSVIEKAAALAVEGHKNQTRKHGTPYVVHPFMVASLLIRHGFSDDIVAAALIHDILEDTEIGEETIEKELGHDVLQIVLGLTEDKTLEWKKRKEAYIELVRNSSDKTKAVSLGDKVHNMMNMHFAYSQMGSDLWKSFGRGKEERMWFENSMIKMLRDEGWEHALLDEYEVLVRKFEELT